MLKHLPLSSLIPCFAVDPAACGGYGVPAGLSTADARQNGGGRFRSEKLYLLIGPPVCTMLSARQALSRGNVDVAVLRLAVRRGMVHLRFARAL